jgi:hypothetical protein
MSVQTESKFAQAIQDHLDLKARNSTLDDSLSLDRYSVEDPFENHPLFKSEEQARLEETMDGTEPAVGVGSALPWPGEETVEDGGAPLDEALWGRSRDFDWGD